MTTILQRLSKYLGECRTILEIGACSGGDTMTMLSIFPTATIYAFEPDPRNAKIIHNRIVNDRLKFFQMAISDKDGTKNFYQSSGTRREFIPGLGESMRMASGSTRQPKDHITRHPWCQFNEGVQVVSRRLDTWCDDNNITAIDLIWADVNGGEKDLISGAQISLTKTRYLYTEFGPDDAEVYDGSMTKNQIIDLLPNFEEVFVHNNNVFLRNMELTQ